MEPAEAVEVVVSTAAKPAGIAFLPSQGLTDENMALINDVVADCRARQLHQPTVTNVAREVARFLRWVQDEGVSWASLSARDVKRYYGVDRRSTGSLVLSSVILRGRFSLLERTDLADAVPRIKPKKPEDFPVLSEDDVARMLAAARKPQQQLRLLMIFELGARAGEICNLRIGDVRIDKYGAVVRLNGKTGMRPRRVIKSAKMLEEYLLDHPRSADPSAFLFYGRSPERRTRTETMLAMVKVLAKKAGINKKVWTHLLRHSAATVQAMDYTDAELEQLFGWARGSGMVKRYRHKIDQDRLERKQLAVAGIAIEEDRFTRAAPSLNRAAPSLNRAAPSLNRAAPSLNRAARPS